MALQDLATVLYSCHTRMQMDTLRGSSKITTRQGKAAKTMSKTSCWAFGKIATGTVIESPSNGRKWLPSVVNSCKPKRKVKRNIPLPSPKVKQENFATCSGKSDAAAEKKNCFPLQSTALSTKLQHCQWHCMNPVVERFPVATVLPRVLGVDKEPLHHCMSHVQRLKNKQQQLQQLQQ